ncbi:Gryzun, putative trafficking through golgi-domain-containing protein [Morchella snyderi]|nr:Gryzun, putative trafficking through golgi-domain-containing protein [Morchella snyderi]
MDAYPPELVTHETPLLIVSGLGAPERHSPPPPPSPAYPLLEQNGSLIACAVPPVTTPAAELLLDCFLMADCSGIWTARPALSPAAERQRPQTPAWRIRAVGRDYTLPPRKASPPTDEHLSAPSGDSPPPTATASRALHSPISPLSPASPLYPDGVLTPLWLRKHQTLLPAAFCAAYELYTATNDAPLQNQHDNALIAAINQQKRFFAPPGAAPSATAISTDDVRSPAFRSRFVVALLSDRSILSCPRIDDRLAYIRRSTNLVPGQTFFFLPAHSSPVEARQFVTTLLTALHPHALDYYRELSKHARRKRNRGAVPPPTVPASRPLSLHAWALRYELKLAVFADFRAEPDAAARAYEAAYEKLFAEVFETTTSWSARWTEARLLADALALRIVRCHLAAEQYTAAKRRWGQHAAQTAAVLDRKGLGTGTYGFSAWMARWNRCLAELLQAAGLPVLAPAPAPPGPPLKGPSSPSSLLDVEGGREAQALWVGGEKGAVVLAGAPGAAALPAGDCLHHPGFYYMAAAEHLGERARRGKRVSADAKESSYDTYLCLAPAEEVAWEGEGPRIALLALARREFEARGQRRMACAVLYSVARLRMAAAAAARGGGAHAGWGEALKDLRAAAGVYRREGWWEVLEEVLWAVVECGRNSGDGGSVVVAGLELLCGEVFKERRGWRYDLGQCLEGMEAVKVRPTMVVRGGDVVSFLTATYTFSTPKVHVGDSITSQLTITSTAHPSSTPITFTELKLTFDGPLKPIHLHHSSACIPPPTNKNTNTATTTTATVTKLDLKTKLTEQHPTPDAPSFLAADTDLTLAPGETKVFELAAVLREAGDAKAVCATFVFASDGFELDFMLMLEADEEEGAGGMGGGGGVHVLPSAAARRRQATANGGSGAWWVEAPAGGRKDRDSAEGAVELRRKPVRAAEPGRVEVLPRPPKMDVTARSAVVGDVYVNELVRIEFGACNGEDEEAVVAVEVRILGWPAEEPPKITWLSDDGEQTPAQLLPTTAHYPLGALPPGASATRTFTFPSPAVPADCAIEITAHYHLVSDPETPISKPVVAEMPVINPFRTSFDFSPRVHPAPWPDYFSLPDDGGALPLGITQRWALTVTIAAQGEGTLHLTSWALPVHATAGGIVATVAAHGPDPVLPKTLNSGAPATLTFLLDVQKLSLEDRRAASADVALELSWRRADAAPGWPDVTNTTALPVPRLPVPGSEPRVLAAVVAGPGPVPGVLHLQYVLENPTNYFLTFSVVMEASEGFAFSGPKQTVVQVLPVARVAMGYRLFVRGGEKGVWVRPVLRVVDRYFNKTLRVSPGSEGVGLDKNGVIVWVPTGEVEDGGGEQV